MESFIAAHTDIGQREVNQDAFCVQTAHSCRGDILMAVLCDGMGGADKGELASEGTIDKFKIWFHHVLSALLADMRWEELMIQSLVDLVKKRNAELIRYGTEHNIRIGTTCSCIVVIENDCFIVHIGDSRIYELTCTEIRQLTIDHNIVSEELQKGLITAKQAKVDKRRNILTRCIGIRDEASPQILHWKENKEVAYILCSDGFSHYFNEKEILEELNYKKLSSEKYMKKQLVKYTEYAKKQNEQDNITSVFVSVRKQGEYGTGRTCTENTSVYTG